MSKIIAAPNPVLSFVAKDYPLSSQQKDKKLSEILRSMENALLSADDPKGVGLAAPQIGISFAIFLARPGEKTPISVFINPKIVELGDSKKKDKPNKKSPKQLEGCLSLPTIWGEVSRPSVVKLKYFDEKGVEFTKTFKGLMAVIVQHEVDHLNGVLFPKRVLEQGGMLYKSHKNKKGQDVFDEIKF